MGGGMKGHYIGGLNNFSRVPGVYKGSLWVL